MKKSAVQWLLNELSEIHENSAIAQKAKEIEKERMIQFCTEYATSLKYGDGLTPTEFYNQTFNKQTK
jgi:hypothetical protein